MNLFPWLRCNSSPKKLCTSRREQIKRQNTGLSEPLVIGVDTAENELKRVGLANWREGGGLGGMVKVYTVEKIPCLLIPRIDPPD